MSKDIQRRPTGVRPQDFVTPGSHKLARDAKKKSDFLVGFAKYGSLIRAAKEAGISIMSYRYWVDANYQEGKYFDLEFCKKMQLAESMFLESLIEELRERAVEGKSDQLLKFLIQRLDGYTGAEVNINVDARSVTNNQLTFHRSVQKAEQEQNQLPDFKKMSKAQRNLWKVMLTLTNYMDQLESEHIISWDKLDAKSHMDFQEMMRSLKQVMPKLTGVYVTFTDEPLGRQPAIRKMVAADLFPETTHIEHTNHEERPTTAEVIPIGQLRGIGGRVFLS